MVTLESLAIEDMSFEERMSLARQIVETVPVEHRVEHPSPWLRKFLQDRLKECEAEPDDGTDWRIVMSEARQRLLK
jgi:hypothetical protein